MMIENGLFIVFAGLLLFSALMVITLQNPVKSVLFLVLAFFAAAGLWLLLTAEFLSLILILVYVGAVMTLFLFVVMTLNIDLAGLKQNYLKFYIPLGLVFTAVLSALLIYAVSKSHLLIPATLPANNNLNQNLGEISNTVELGKLLYTQYALQFEITGVILLVAIIAAISLAIFQPFTSKHQSVEAQININKSDRIRTVK